MNNEWHTKVVDNYVPSSKVQSIVEGWIIARDSMYKKVAVIIDHKIRLIQGCQQPRILGKPRIVCEFHKYTKNFIKQDGIIPILKAESQQ